MKNTLRLTPRAWKVYQAALPVSRELDRILAPLNDDEWMVVFNALLHPAPDVKENRLRSREVTHASVEASASREALPASLIEKWNLLLAATDDIMRSAKAGNQKAEFWIRKFSHRAVDEACRLGPRVA